MAMLHTLVYDASCPFCSGLAHWFKDHYGVSIVANDKTSAIDLGVPQWRMGDMKKDVHLVEDLNDPKAGKWRHGKRVFHGAAAAARLLSIKHPIVWTLYSFKPLGLCFDLSYFVIKKIKKHLPVVS